MTKQSSKQQEFEELEKIRRLALQAIYLDDELYETFVLKGGNALSIVYGIGQRTSLDLDFSIEEDLKDIQKTKGVITTQLKRIFGQEGYTTFDENLKRKPKKQQEPEWWGGYAFTFKIISTKKFAELGINKSRIQALAPSTPGEKKTFKIDISKYEHCEREEHSLNNVEIRVYPLSLIVAEKLRALCQQTEDYQSRFGGKKLKPRARDFYDIHTILQSQKIEFQSKEFKEKLQNVFQKKEVPLALLMEIKEKKDFYLSDWPSVVNSIQSPLDFDIYFQFVTEKIEELEMFWNK